MSKFVHLASAAILAVGFASSANALECVGSHDTAALRCAWDFYGNYDVKSFESHYGNQCDIGPVAPSKGSSCLGALNDLEGGDWGYYLHSSTGNVKSDTYILHRCSQVCE